MKFKGTRVRIVDATNQFISVKYINSNARSRVKRDGFMNNVKSGLLEIVNPEILGKE